MRDVHDPVKRDAQNDYGLGSTKDTDVLRNLEDAVMCDSISVTITDTHDS